MTTGTLFLDENNLARIGMDPRNIRTMRALTDFLNLVGRVANQETITTDQQTQIDAAAEAIEDANVSLGTLDTRVDTLETFQAAGPYAKLAGGAGAAFTGAVSAPSLDIAGLAQCDSFRIDAAPSVSAATASTHKLSFSANGTTYYFLLTNV